MRITVDFSILAEGKWYEYAARFVLGGLATVAAGLIARKFGPELGGLFLAFPAILPATTTLIDKHQRERKEQKGLSGARRGRQAAGLDAAGATLGSIGLFAFACVAWKWIPRHSALLVIAVATVTYVVVSVTAWAIRQRI
jgi:hypothetical protein